MRISAWSSDVFSSDLAGHEGETIVSRSVKAGIGVGPEPQRWGWRGAVGNVPRPDAVANAAQVGQQLVHARCPVDDPPQTRRASCRERVCPYVSISCGDLSLTQKQQSNHYVLIQ